MSHMVESLAYAGAVPWHGLGVKLADRLTADEMVRCAGLDWTVEGRPVFTGDPFTLTAIPGVKAIVRIPHGNVLKVVTDDYGIVQNAQLAELADAMAGEGAAWEVAGCLDEGRRVFFCGQVGAADIAGDYIANYLTLASSHDASLGVTAIRTPVRVVCANTLGAALSDSSPRISIRHTKNAEAKVKLAAKLVREARAYFGTFNEQALAMVGATVSVIEAAELASALFPDYRSEDTGQIVTPRLRDVVLGLFKGQRDVAAERRVAGTRWGFYQALTAALDHNRGGSDRSKLSRYLSGSDETLRSKAWRLLTGRK